MMQTRSNRACNTQLCSSNDGARRFFLGEVAIVLIAPTQGGPRRDVQAELKQLKYKTVYWCTVSHFSTNGARRRSTSLIHRAM